MPAVGLPLVAVPPPGAARKGLAGAVRATIRNGSSTSGISMIPSTVVSSP
ncbi:hypothetical protein ACFQ6U_20470 [Streptomyces sp. NPDC056465]